MNVKSVLLVPRHSRFADTALLLIRVVAGLAFTMHGWGKIQHPLNWMGPEGFAPGFLQALAAASEFGGGIGWVLGLLTPLASLGILCTMGVAFSMHTFMRGDPFVASGPGQFSSEPAAGYFCIAFLLLAMGPGRVSLDRMIFGSR